MVEVGVGEKAVQTAHDVVQVLLGIRWDCNSVEIVGVNNGCSVVQCVDHVVDGTAVRLSFVSWSRTNIYEFFISSHLWA